jgi:crossover junction endodeoxyribonuclease RusA
VALADLDEVEMIIKLPWPPTGLSPNARNHWAKIAKLKKQYRESCFWHAMEQGARPIQSASLHLTLTFYPPTRRQYDLDNALARMKAGLDGLADVLKVDDKHWTLTIRKGETVGGFVEVHIERPTE